MSRDGLARAGVVGVTTAGYVEAKAARCDQGVDVMDAAVPDLTLRPVLESPSLPEWDGALWIGEVWVDAADRGRILGEPIRCRLQGAQRFNRARLLVRAEAGPLGFVEVGVSDGYVDFSELRCRVADLRITPVRPIGVGHPGRAVTVVLLYSRSHCAVTNGP